MFSNAVKLFSISGFDIKIDPSWLIIAALVAWSLSQHYFPMTLPDETATAYLVMGVVTTILFFASLLMHELAHACVARRYGLSISGITLFLFGGVAELESEPHSPKVECLVAIAGPAMSLVLSLSLFFLTWVTSLFDDLVLVVKVLSYLALINLVLTVFNLVPALPLDGGRILRAYLWHRHGNLLRATETAAKSGIVLAFALMGIGVLALFRGTLIPALWQILIGGFLLIAARSAYQRQLVHVVFDKRTVRDMMEAQPVTVEPDTTLSVLVDQVLLRGGLSFLPVVEDGVLLGHVDHEMISAIDRENWTATRVGDVFAGLDNGASIDPEMAVEDLVNHMAATGRRKFLVVQDGRLAGVISLSDLARHLRLSDLVTAT